MEKFRTKELTLIAVFSAAWIGYTFISNMTIGQIVHGVDVHVVRSVFLVLVVALLGRFGGATWMTVIVGIFYLSSRTPYPAVIITAATIVSGLIYDLYIRVFGYNNSTNWKVMPVGVVLAGLAQSVVTMGSLTYMGFFPERILQAAWVTGLGRNVLASVIACVICLTVAKRIVATYGKLY